MEAEVTEHGGPLARCFAKRLSSHSLQDHNPIHERRPRPIPTEEILRRQQTLFWGTFAEVRFSAASSCRRAKGINHWPLPRCAPWPMVGAYDLARDTIVTTGAFLGAALWKLGPALNFWSASALGAAGTLFYLLNYKPKPAF